jgi:hypothetical protein
MSGDDLEAQAKAARELAEGIVAGFATFMDFLSVLGASWQKVADKLAPLAAIDWGSVKRRLDELPAKSKAAMTQASAKGWFFGWEDSLQELMQLIDKLATAGPNGIDAVMAEYYRKNFEFFSRALLEAHPNRAQALTAALNAHKAGGSDGYYLSIPVFVAQSDGLLTEITKTDKSALMRARGGTELRGSEALRKMLAADQESLDLIDPILRLHELDLFKSESERQVAARKSGATFIALNRHQVMHGESWDYGSETNSLKAFSLLAFVGLHLRTVLESAQSRTTP